MAHFHKGDAMSERTEGEWVACYKPDDGGADVSSCRGGGKVAECGAPGKGRWPLTQQEIVANARLIAAAPELLAALEAMYRADQEGWPLGTGELIRKNASAAIAKATGGNQ